MIGFPEGNRILWIWREFGKRRKGFCMSDTLAAFLADYKLLGMREQETNFLAVCDVSCKEEVFSNVLAYFLDEDAAVLAALLDCAGISFENDQVFDVRREETTEGGKRIDIVVETSRLVVGIENKIYAGLNNNPLADYWRHLQKIACGSPARNVVGIVLSLNRIGTDIGQFKAVTFGDFVNHVKPHYAAIEQNLGTRKFVWFLEFIKNINFLQEGNMEMSEFLKQVGKDADTLRKTEEIFTLCKKVPQLMLRHVERIIDDCRESWPFRSEFFPDGERPLMAWATFFQEDEKGKVSISVEVTPDCYQVYVQGIEDKAFKFDEYGKLIEYLKTLFAKAVGNAQ